ncbi:Ig-like domain-containing protein [Nocardioides lianchengensis]|uniref:Ig-like domain (Group 3) n=1 Tax=Nocardioides lianchengensis TaxID=1045774 RepID=A0A1G6XP52_9ACTN|nr:Ig-like domain-containing protein [Nocardioides lianchengensis]NYG13383.1 hypothetical protein [Nocardioides lianchengensis]SDD79999.1 hypothetical protein SAMN05421872_11126 [Nocardioides lianchengensis]
MNRSLPRRSLSAVLSAGLLAGGLLAVPAAAADPEPPTPLPTTTVLSPIPDAVVDEGLTLSATVGTGGQGVPTGTVEFRPADDLDGDPVASAPLVDDGVGSTDDAVATSVGDVTVGRVGTPSYVATYVPDAATWEGSESDPVQVTVTGLPVTVTVTLDRVEAAVGDTVTATVTSTASDGAVAADPSSSTIAFGSDAASAWGAGVTSPSVTATVAGTHQVTVDVAPADPTRYADPAAQSATVKVGVPTTTTFDPIPPASPDAGGSLTLTAVVATQGAGRPAGTVVFSKVDGSTVTDLGSPAAVALGPVAGNADRATASRTIPAPASDAVSYRARFVPTDTAAHAASVSTDHAVTPQKRTVTVTVVAPSAPVPRGGNATVTVTAKDGANGVAQDGSTVTVTVGDGTPQALTGVAWSADGSATISVPTAAAGRHTVSVTFVPDDTAVYALPDAQTATFEVARPTTTTLTGPSTTLVVQDDVPLQARVSSGGHGIPSGRVDLYTVDEDGDPSANPVDTEVLPTSGAGTTADSAEVSFIPEAVDGTTTYRAVFEPTDDADFATSEDDAEVTAEQAQVDVAIGVAATIPTTASTFTIRATEVGAGTPVKAASLVVKLDTTTLPASAVTWNAARTVATVTITPGTAGSHTVEATLVPDNAVRYDAPGPASRSVVAKHPQTIHASVTGPYYADGDLAVGVTDNQTAASAVSTTPLTCSASTLTVSLLAPGACQLTVTAVEDGTHLAGTTVVDFTVVKRPVGVVLDVDPGSPVYEDDVVITATATGTGKTASLPGEGTLTVTREDETEPVLTRTYHFGATPQETITLPQPEVGTYQVAVDFTPGTAALRATYEDGSDSESLVVGLGTQAVDVEDEDDHLFVGKTWIGPASGSKSGTPATLEVLPLPGDPVGAPLHCAATGTDGHDLKMLSEGSCRVRMTVAETERYAKVVLVDTFDVALRSIDLQVTAAPTDTTDTATRYREPVTIKVVATDGDADGTPGPVSGHGTVTVKSPAGTLTQRDLVLVAGTGEVTFLPTELAGHEVVVSVEEPDPVAGTATYAPLAAPATAQETFDVEKGRQPITWGPADASAPDGPYLVDETWVPSAIGGGSPHAVGLTSNTPSTCAVDGTTIRVIAAPAPATVGTPVVCTIHAHQDGNELYLDGDREATFVVTPRPVTVTLDWTADAGSAGVFGDDVTITATATDDTDDTPVPDVEATDDDPAEVSGTGVIIVDGHRFPVTFHDGVATYSWTADTVGDHLQVSAEFDPTREDVFAVAVTDRNDLKITKRHPGRLDPAEEPPTAPNIGDVWKPRAPSLGSSQPVTITAGPSAVCEVLGQPTDVGGQSIRFLSLDECAYSITQAGDHHYLAATPYDGSVEVVKVAVRLVPTPPSGAVYGDEVAVGFTATDSKKGDELAGDLDLAVTDEETGDVTHHELQAADGAFTLQFDDPLLLAGDYTVDASFEPENSEDYAPQDATTTFAVALHPQTAALAPAGQDLAATQEIHATWKPSFALTDSKEPVQLVVVASGSAAETQAEYEPGGRFHGDDSLDPVAERWVAKPLSCVVSTDRSTVTFVAEGPCRLQAVAPAVERKYAASPPAFTKVVRAERTPQSLKITPPEGQPTVGVRLRVKADARIGNPGVRAAAGRGPLTVLDPTGAEVPGSPSAKVNWYGGGQVFNFTPRKAGIYKIDAAFRSTDRFAYDWVGVDPDDHTFEVLPGPQDLRLVTAPPSSQLVGQSWVPDVAPTASGQPVDVRRKSGPCTVRAATPGDAETPATPRTVTFDGIGPCVLELHAAATADYVETTVTLPTIQMEQTAVDVTVRSGDLQVGSPATIFVTATSATDGRAVDGSGTVLLTVGGTAVPEGEVVRSAWTNGEQRLSWTPTTAAHDLKVEVDFDPATSSYTPVRNATRTLGVASGAQWVRVGTEPDTAVHVDETWKPSPSGAGAPGAAVTVTATPASVCVVDGTGDDTTISYRAAGTCTVTTSLPQRPAHVAAGVRPDWVGAQRVDVIRVAAHPSTLSLTLPPQDELLFGRQLVLRAQVVGRVGNAGTPEPVAGTVQFTYDGEVLEPDTDPDTVPPADPTRITLVDGWAEIRVTLTEEHVLDGELSYRHEFGAVFTPTADQEDYWIYEPDGIDPVAASVSLQQTEVATTTAPAALRIGQTWTTGVELPGRDLDDLVMSLRPGDETACAIDPDEHTLTVLQVTSTDQQCEIRYHAETDGQWAAAREVRQPVRIVRHPTNVTVSATNTPTAGGPLGLQAVVLSPGAEATATTTGVEARIPTGNVEFFVGDDSVGTAPTIDGRATLAVPVAPRAGNLPLKAVFVPTGGAASPYAGDDSPPTTVPVAPAPTTTGTVTILDGRLSANVSRTLQPVPPITGEVEFSYQALTAGSPWTAIGRADVTAGTAVLAAMPPATEAVRLRAEYVGDGHHLGSTGATTERLLPTITWSLTSGSSTGWNGQAVRVVYKCTPPIGVQLDGTCPPYEFTRDGRDQSVTATVKARNGGQASVTVSGINVDRTAPTVSIGGVAPGVRYRGTTPRALCRGRDALSGVASCTITRSPLGGDRYRDVAVVVDRAGNRGTARVDFEILDEWVRNAPLVQGGFQVKRGTKQRIVVRTDGPQPQLMLPDKKGRLRPSKVLRASDVTEGYVTWFVDVTVPQSVRNGRSWRIGYRLVEDRSVQEVRMRLDVVRKPAAGDRRRR